MVEAANTIALHPAGTELRPSVRAAKFHQVWCTALAAVEGEVLAHDADGLGVARRQVLGAIHRLPEPTHVSAGERTRPGVGKIRIVGRGMAGGTSGCSATRGHDVS